ncbi:MAG TPA: hypothetical protein VK432_06090 [Stellaceae bacterium]|nr:hypothetical protein [Stellaceae bacterium]
MKTASSGDATQVCRAENGQFIAFWQGSVVYKFDGTLRYFETEQAARGFLGRREFVRSSIIGRRRDSGSRHSIALK